MALTLTKPFLPSLSTINKSPSFPIKGRGGGGGGGIGRWTCMKKDIHPEVFEDAKVYCNGELVMTTGGTQREYTVDVWSGNHPFYLGSRSANLVDADQVEKFRKKFGQLSGLMEIPNLKYGEIVLPTKKKSGTGPGGKKKK